MLPQIILSLRYTKTDPPSGRGHRAGNNESRDSIAAHILSKKTGGIAAALLSLYFG
jgi:hypothetical protein